MTLVHLVITFCETEKSNGWCVRNLHHKQSYYLIRQWLLQLQVILCFYNLDRVQLIYPEPLYSSRLMVVDPGQPEKGVFTAFFSIPASWWVYYLALSWFPSNAVLGIETPWHWLGLKWSHTVITENADRQILDLQKNLTLCNNTSKLYIEYWFAGYYKASFLFLMLGFQCVVKGVQ